MDNRPAIIIAIVAIALSCFSIGQTFGRWKAKQSCNAAATVALTGDTMNRNPVVASAPAQTAFRAPRLQRERDDGAEPER